VPGGGSRAGERNIATTNTMGILGAMAAGGKDRTGKPGGC
jgi:hypothetical protein